MPIFTRILDFKRVVLARLRNKRRHPRYRVNLGFPLKASLSLVGSGNFNPDRPPVRGRGVNWGGGAGDLSANGLSILLSPAATTARGEPTILRLTLENHEIVVPCTIAHFRVYNSHAVCGVQLEFADFEAQKAYLQILEAVKLGASFAAAVPGRSSVGLVSRSWHSTGRVRLTEWREAETRALDRFELSLGEHTVQGAKAKPGLEVRSRKGGARSVSPAVHEEVSQMFRWIVGNLPKGVPADLRQLMVRAGGDPLALPASAARPAPVAAETLAAPTGMAPVVAWEAPKPRASADTVA